VGDTEIRKGEGMQLDQLIQDTSYSRGTNARIQPFDLDVLREAFQLRETAPIDLPLAEKGIPTTAGKSKSESKDKERKHKKHKDRDREKDKEHKKHKHRHKDRSKDKDKEKKKDKSGHHDSGAEPSNKHHEKKRKHDGDEDLNDIHSHKKSKHKSSKIEETGAIRVAGWEVACSQIFIFIFVVQMSSWEFGGSVLTVVKFFEDAALTKDYQEGEFTWIYWTEGAYKLKLNYLFVS